MASDIEVELSAANVVEIKGRHQDGFTLEISTGPAPCRGLMMALPPRINTACGGSANCEVQSIRRVSGFPWCLFASDCKRPTFLFLDPVSSAPPLRVLHPSQRGLGVGPLAAALPPTQGRDDF